MTSQHGYNGGNWNPSSWKTGTFILHNQYHRCWWPMYRKSHGTSSRGAYWPLGRYTHGISAWLALRMMTDHPSGSFTSQMISDTDIWFICYLRQKRKLCFYVCWFVCFCQSVCRSVRLSVCRHVCLSACLLASSFCLSVSNCGNTFERFVWNIEDTY